MSDFYGLNLIPGVKYNQYVKRTFYLTGVSLDNGGSAKFTITVEGERFTLANLSPWNAQAPLDLKFVKGDVVMFQSFGSGSISIFGHLTPNEDNSNNSDSSDDSFQLNSDVEYQDDDNDEDEEKEKE